MVEQFKKPSRLKTHFHQNWVTILPCTRTNIMVNDVRGVRDMLAGQVLVSAVVGLAAMVGMIALSAPILVSLAVYPAVCSLTLLLTAVLRYNRAVDARQDETFSRAQA
jgi:hypothetical protein